MPSMTQCALRNADSCNQRVATTYFKGTKHEFGLCRQCQTRLSVRMVVDSCMNGGDIEAIFKDIMTLLAKEKRVVVLSPDDEDE